MTSSAIKVRPAIAAAVLSALFLLLGVPWPGWLAGALLGAGLWVGYDNLRALRVLNWLRLGDARPLYRAWLAKTQWPEGFWHRVERIWLRHEVGVVCAWHNEQSHQDMTVADQGIATQLTLDWPLLQALASQDDTTQDVDA